MTWRSILVAALVTTSIIAGGIATAQPADDKWPDSCRNARIVDETGTYTGSIVSPDDDDAFHIELAKGEYVAVTIGVSKEEGRFSVHHRQRTGDEAPTAKNIEGAGSASSSFITQFDGGTVTYELWAEDDQRICFELDDSRGDEADTPYRWEVSLEKEAPEPPELTLADRSSGGAELKEKEERIDELEAELEKKKERINELESEIEEQESGAGNNDDRVAELEAELEDREERIKELEDEIETLEAQLEEEGGVIFNIEVVPSEGDQFAVNDYAVVNVESQNADPEELNVEHGETTYDVKNSKVRIPLEEPGEQQITFEHNGETETTVINVEGDRQSGGGTESQQDNGTDLGLSGKIGLGIVAVLGGLYKLVVSS